ncbi:hypothetical protein HYH03_003650 [Edaphochlamys debaryana]|uniref:Macro domain-containing protein n=1 Tax=Edaphochlamys debaryana TaxID=47281 RepID=A0A835Y9B3_9CHLO|nr:hypothetical protein HYH03_003650 [Edaphochlamys debaryana]|eukprot:KAG2498391.1 hypothetical protein HYH03_003650 [Edaphochlamys debaryana]
MRIILVDLHTGLAEAAAQVGWPGEVLARTNLADVQLAYTPGSAVVSPANSFGFMDGGVDLVISRIMYPGVQTVIRDMIADGPHRTHLRRPYLPIGDALSVPVPGKPGVLMIAAPTMWLPQDVQTTHNAYHATYAALAAASAAGTETLIFPGMCTGYGKMSPAHAVSQMADAIHDWRAGRSARWDAPTIVAEQPNVYMNIEFSSLADFRESKH